MKPVSILLFCFVSFFANASSLDPIHKEVTEIAKKIHQANGNFIYGDNIPTIIINSTKQDGASYDSDRRILTIDLALYKMCQSFGSQSQDALAFIIGHELAHHYMEHQDLSGIFQYTHIQDKEVEQESKADIYGLFNAHLAGYGSMDLLPEVIEQLYTTYNLPDTLEGYLPKEERMKMAREVVKVVKELIDINEAANHLTAVGEYHLAALSYEYILKHYRGREIYNNLAINYILEALTEHCYGHSFYLYPIELDWKLRLEKNIWKGFLIYDLKEEEIYRNNALIKAEKYLKTAIRMDANYLLADIHLLCIYTLKEDYQRAIAYYQQLQRSNKLNNIPINQKESARIALGIANARIANKLEAKKIFSSLTTSRHPKIAFQAKYNLNILEKTKNKSFIFEQLCEVDINVPAIIDGIRIHSFTSDSTHIIPLHSNITLTIDKKSSSKVYQYYQKNAVAFTFQQIDLPLPNLTKSKQSFKQINTTEGYFLICDEARLAFYYSLNNRLKSWGKYYR